MKKKAASPSSIKRSPATSKSRADFSSLMAEVRSLVHSARQTAATAVNTLQVLTNFEIGRRIVEHEQQGAKRASYGTELLNVLSAGLTEDFGSGFSVTNLKLMRQFFIEYSGRIGQTAPDQSARRLSIRQTVSDESANPKGLRATSSDAANKFTLSWSHYVLLLTIENPDERRFYEIEATAECWSLRELKRQKAACLYERLALSRDKRGLRRLADKGQLIERPEDILKEPVVLEFLGLEVQAKYSESDLEAALIDHLEQFLLELGKGFLFEARQKRFTFDEDNYFLDLVFYNRLLRCYVLIDLKLDKLTHQDLGQMQMYVNYYDRHVRLPDENPTVGLVLCKQKKAAVVELTLPKDSNIHARQYQLYLPSKELLQQKLLEWTRDAQEHS
jgi:predicted nuclease of restriction endonuclease-like (RecB) superfamily